MKKRETGILLHISSLPSNYGIGSLGKEAYEFIDFLSKSNVHIWQILPLTLTSYGDSPYQSPSSKALNPYFIDLDLLIEDGLLKKEEVENIKWGDNVSKVNYQYLFDNRYKVLKKAFGRFNRSDETYQKFLKEKVYQDFAVFMTLKEIHSCAAWYTWNDKYQNYTKEIEEEVLTQYKDLVAFYEWTQFIFLKQYVNLKEYAHKHDVKIMGDIPIYVAFDSAEVWKYPDLFQLDSKHFPTNVAGCPPDCFSEDGQLWGNPLYNWDNMKKDHYSWWNERINYNLGLYDLMRIDHFRGFSGYYSIPYGDKTARNGKWVKGPGADLFLDKLNLPIIAEDLGMMDDDFYKMMDTVKYPGMKIVDQGFDGDPRSIWKPSNYTENFYSYSATHDSPTTLQFIEELDEKGRKNLLSDLENECKIFNLSFKKDSSNKEFVHKICELNLASKTEVAILPMQDLLQLGKEARMNYPSTLSDKNWSWRSKKEDFSDLLVSKVNGWNVKFGRN